MHSGPMRRIALGVREEQERQALVNVLIGCCKLALDYYL